MTHLEAFLEEARKLCSVIEYKDWTIEVGCKIVVPYLRVVCPTGTCNITGETLPWNGRKWILSTHMVKSEIVQTAFLAVMTAIEHETRETFRYKGVAIYSPHFNADVLHGLWDYKTSFDVREG